MYELIIKILGEKDYKRYTIEDLQEIKEILKDLQTIEVRLRRIEDKIIKDNKSLWSRPPTEETRRRSI